MIRTSHSPFELRTSNFELPSTSPPTPFQRLTLITPEKLASLGGRDDPGHDFVRFRRRRIGSNEVLRNIERDNLLAFFETL